MSKTDIHAQAQAIAVSALALISACAEAAWTPVAEPAAALACDARVNHLSSEKGGVRFYTLTVTGEIRRLEFELSGGRGDADLYVRYGEPPTPAAFDFRPFVEGNDERVMIDNPTSGIWHVAVHAMSDYEDVSLEVRCRGHASEVRAREIRSPRDMELALYYELFGVPPREETWSAELRKHALREEGRSAFNAGDFQRALNAWTRWHEMDPANPEPISLIGDIYLRRGNIAEAVAHYRRSLAVQPSQIALMIRLVRLIDQELKQPVEARNMLNLYARLFPNHPDVTLAQAEWLLWRRRYDEASDLIRRVIDSDWENLRARSLIHGLLSTPEERYANMLAMLAVGEKPGMETFLAQAIIENSLLTRPESWALFDFVERMSLDAPFDALRDLCASLLPRDSVAVEDFRLGRMSRNWISSRELMWNEEGAVVLSADVSQTEAYLRLTGSDALHSAFLEASIGNARGFFWIYARRGEGNMVRFGFDESGLLYQQIWMNGQLRYNESRLWSKPEGPTTLRLEVRADGAHAFVDGRPAFSSPMSIPRDMGLGWWGIAPWSPELGHAAITVHRVAGGPLPVRIATAQEADLDWSEPRLLDRLQRQLRDAQVLIPDWYVPGPSGGLVKRDGARDLEMRMLAHYYRVRLMPRIPVASALADDWTDIRRVAERDRLDGYTVVVDRMPKSSVLLALEARAVKSGVALLLVLYEPDGAHALVREINPNVGLFGGARRPHRLPIRTGDVPVPPGAEGLLFEIR